MGHGMSDVWVGLVQFLSGLGMVRPGDIVEIVTNNPVGVIDGAALAEVTNVRPRDPVGVDLGCQYRGSMRPQQGVMFGWLFPEGGGDGLLHLFCRRLWRVRSR